MEGGDEVWARDQLLAPGRNTWPTTARVQFRNQSLWRRGEKPGDMHECVAPSGPSVTRNLVSVQLFLSLTTGPTSPQDLLVHAHSVSYFTKSHLFGIMLG